MEQILAAAAAFREYARELGTCEIVDVTELAQFWARLKAVTSGLVIVDFLDLANWDYFTDSQFDPATRILKIIWHDYTDRAPDDISRMIFPGELYGFVMKLQSVQVIALDQVTLFMLRGYTVKEKELAALIGKGADEYHVDKESLFRRSVYKRRGSSWELWHCHVAPLYSVAILPKGVGASDWQAYLILYLQNLSVADQQLAGQFAELQALPADDWARIGDRANATRRIFESVLKIECAYRQVRPEREYPELKLGDLIKALRDFETEADRQRLNKIVRVLNEYSHDAGFPLVKANLTEVLRDVVHHTRGLLREVEGKLRRAA